MKIRKIYNEIQLIWNEKTNSYDTIYEDSYSHDGEIYEMAKSEVDLSGAENAATLLTKISKAAKRVTREFDGWSKASKENADVLKILARNSKGAEGSIEKLVKAYKDQIEAMLKVKAITDAEKEAKKKLADLNKKNQQSIKASNKLINQQIEAERKLKNLNIKAHQKAVAAERKKHLAIIKKHVKLSKQEAATKERVRRELLSLNHKLKEYNVNLKTLNVSQETYRRALNGNKVALDKIRRTTQQVIKTGKLHGKQLKNFQVSHHRNAMSLSRLRSQLLMVAFAMGLMKRAFTFLTEAYMKQEKAEAMVSSAIKATGMAAGFTSKEIFNYAKELQELTAIGDEVILSSSALLLTFRNIGGTQFKNAQRNIIDLTLALNQGTISEEKMKSATIMLGKALNDPVRGMNALSRSGVTFNLMQKDLVEGFIEMGDTAAAQDVILEELERQIGGLGEAFALTTEGKIMAMQGAFGDLKEEMATVFIPVIIKLVEAFTWLIEKMNTRAFKIFITVLVIMTGHALLANSGIMAMSFSLTGLSTALFGATAATTAFGAALLVLRNTLLMTTAIIAGLTIATKVYEHFFGKFTNGIIEATEAQKAKAKVDAAQLEKEFEKLKVQEDSIKALEIELKVLKAKTKLEKWMITQNRDFLDTEIALKKEIIEITEAREIEAKGIKAVQSASEKLMQLEEKSNQSRIDLYKARYGAESDIVLKMEEQAALLEVAQGMTSTLQTVGMDWETDDAGELLVTITDIDKWMASSKEHSDAIALSFYDQLTAARENLKIQQLVTKEIAKQKEMMDNLKAFKDTLDSSAERARDIVLLMADMGKELKDIGDFMSDDPLFKNFIGDLSEDEIGKLLAELFKPMEDSSAASISNYKTVLEANRALIPIQNNLNSLIKERAEKAALILALEEDQLTRGDSIYAKSIEQNEEALGRALTEKEILDLQTQMLRNIADMVGYSSIDAKLLDDQITGLEHRIALEKIILDLITGRVTKTEEEVMLEQRGEQLKSLAVDIANEALALKSQEIEERARLLDEEMKADIARVKKSSEYMMAKKRGDDAAMDRLEKQAQKKTLPARQKAFKEKQHVAAGEVAISTAVALMRANADYGWPAAWPVMAMLTALSVMQLAGVYAPDPPKFAKGGDFTTSGPQMIQVGDNPGGRERVQITPLSSRNINGPQNGGTVNITFSGNVMSDEFIEEQAIPQIKEAIRRGADLGIS